MPPKKGKKCGNCGNLLRDDYKKREKGGFCDTFNLFIYDRRKRYCKAKGFRDGWEIKARRKGE